MSSLNTKTIGTELSTAADRLRGVKNHEDLLQATLPQVQALEGVVGLSERSGVSAEQRMKDLADALQALGTKKPAEMTVEELSQQVDSLRKAMSVARDFLTALESLRTQVTQPEVLVGIHAAGNAGYQGAVLVGVDQAAPTAAREESLRAVLGKNLLGAAEWKKGFGVDVGAIPGIPESITPKLLNSSCPLHPGQLIKDTHILVLIPTTVDGKPYSALKLDELCAKRTGSEDKLIYDGWSDWKRCDWAILPQVKSEWLLLPKSDPDPDKVPVDKHFRSKYTAAQEEVHREHYSEYREARALEVMTIALLNDLVNGEPRILDGWNTLRCMEPDASGGRVCVGVFHANGLRVGVAGVDHANDHIGRALARKT